MSLMLARIRKIVKDDPAKLEDLIKIDPTLTNEALYYILAFIPAAGFVLYGLYDVAINGSVSGALLTIASGFGYMQMRSKIVSLQSFAILTMGIIKYEEGLYADRDIVTKFAEMIRQAEVNRKPVEPSPPDPDKVH